MRPDSPPSIDRRSTSTKQLDSHLASLKTRRISRKEYEAQRREEADAQMASTDELTREIAQVQQALEAARRAHQAMAETSIRRASISRESLRLRHFPIAFFFFFFVLLADRFCMC